MSNGDAIALLLSVRPATRDARDASATRALRDATGRCDITVGRRPSGRPALAPPLPELGVSLASRGTWLLVGFSPTGDVGVDIESESAASTIDPGRLARDHFAPGEAAAVARLAATPDLARRLFLRAWVAKEAVLKVTGRGIADGLAAPDLSGAIEDRTLAADSWGTVVVVGRARVAVVVERRAAPLGDDLHLALARSL